MTANPKPAVTSIRRSRLATTTMVTVQPYDALYRQARVPPNLTRAARDRSPTTSRPRESADGNSWGGVRAFSGFAA